MNDVPIRVMIEGMRKISLALSQMADDLEKQENRNVLPDAIKEPALQDKDTGQDEPPTEPKEGTEAASAAQEGEGMDAAHTDEAQSEGSIDAAPQKEIPSKKEPELSFEQVRGVLAEKARNGHRQQVRELILSHGGNQLSDFKEKPLILASLLKEVEDL